MILTVKYEINTENLELFGVVLGEKDLSGPIIWTLGTLYVSLLVNWMGDFISLGKWNSGLKLRLSDTLWDGGGPQHASTEFLRRSLADLSQKIESADMKDKEIKKIADDVSRRLETLLDSAKWYERSALVYVVVWSFIVPTLMAGYAAYLIYHA